MTRKARPVRFEHPRTGLPSVAVSLHKPVVVMIGTRPEPFQPVFVCEITVVRGRLHYHDGSSYSFTYSVPVRFWDDQRGWDKVRKIMKAVEKKMAKRNGDHL